MAQAAQSKPHWSNWVTLIIAVLLFGGGVVWAAHHEISTVTDRLDRIERRMDKLDSAIRILSKAQSGDTQELIKEILSQAKGFSNAGKEEAARKFTAAAQKLTDAQLAQHAPAQPEFFEKASADLVPISESANAELKAAAFSAQTKLAEYRSALLSLPPARMPPFDGFNVNCNSLPGAEAYGRGNVKTVAGGTISNCMQPLDDIVWVNVTFINSDIYYLGGPVALRNVRFIHCTFHAQQVQAGFQFLQYAALDEKEFQPPGGQGAGPGHPQA
jgi:hypothetical protein